MLEIVPLVLGPVSTNAYLIADSESGEAAVIDPAWDGDLIAAEAGRRSWRIGQIWITHAHFDHIGGAAAIASALDPQPTIAMHRADHNLWRMGGGGILFGFKINPGPKPSLDLAAVPTLRLGGMAFEVRPTPGHTPGHVVFYCAEAGACFCGDLIFKNSVGRTDLPGGSWNQLLESIRKQIFTLPDETRLLSGHGSATTVGEERLHNPFVN